jgi:hypothetical protein
VRPGPGALLEDGGAHQAGVDVFVKVFRPESIKSVPPSASHHGWGRGLTGLVFLVSHSLSTPDDAVSQLLLFAMCSLKFPHALSLRRGLFGW